MAGKNHSFTEILQSKKLAYAGHVFRGSSVINALLVLEGETNGVRVQRGRPTQNWLDDIIEWTNLRGYKRCAEDRNYWIRRHMTKKHLKFQIQ